jgi:hypothetical protein
MSLFKDYPDFGRIGVNPSSAEVDKVIKDFEQAQRAGLLKATDYVFTCVEHMERLVQAFLPKTPSPRVKLWYHHASIRGVFPQRVPGSREYATTPNADTNTLGCENISRAWQELIRDYRATKYGPGTIPLFSAISVTSEEAGRIEYGSGPNDEPPVCYIVDPVTKVPSHPPNVGYIIQDGVLRWFFIDEFRKEFAPTVVSIPVSSEPSFVTVVTDATKSPDDQLQAVKVIMHIVPPPPIDRTLP